MASRLDLHNKLSAISGITKAYFQAPGAEKMTYPCIVYNLNTVYNDYANDGKYIGKKQYSVMLIDKNPDSTIPDEIMKLNYCSMDRVYRADGLYHFVFTIYN